mmetsp:Transcript_54222/g.155869  ORF Transcript_54222/g.155869 Transcript_54222/m.155869 type:complete len:298 (+) Transcript_54222:430-1323(+)
MLLSIDDCGLLRAMRKGPAHVFFVRGRLPTSKNASRVKRLLPDAVHGGDRVAAVEACEQLSDVAAAVSRRRGAKVVAPRQQERLALNYRFALQQEVPNARWPLLPHEDQKLADRQQLLVVGRLVRGHGIQNGHILAPLEELLHLHLRCLVDYENNLLHLRCHQFFAEPTNGWLHDVAHPDGEEPRPYALRRRPHAAASAGDGYHGAAHRLLGGDRQLQGLHAKASHDLHGLVLRGLGAADELSTAVALRAHAFPPGDVRFQSLARQQPMQRRRSQLVRAERHGAGVPAALRRRHERA